MPQKTQQAAAKRIKDAETAARIAAIEITVDLEVINKMTNAKLDAQLEAHQQRDKEVPIKARLGKKDLKLDAAVAWYFPKRNVPVHDQDVHMGNSDEHVRVLFSIIWLRTF